MGYDTGGPLREIPQGILAALRGGDRELLVLLLYHLPACGSMPDTMGAGARQGLLLPIRDRPMDPAEIERMRLLLSTFRDGSGQFVKSIGGYMPGYLDFERATALVCDGDTSEDKGIFDVAVPAPDGLPYGVSCKMSISQPAAHNAGFMELSNSQQKFSDEFRRLGISWRRQPRKAGPAVVDLVMKWHWDVAQQFDIPGSRYLVLSHDRKWEKFQLLCYPLSLTRANPYTEVDWRIEGHGRSTLTGYISHRDRCHPLWRLYQNSGGQLKYYPPLEWAEWKSLPFRLEQPPIKSIVEKVNEYFPGMWPQ